MSSNFEYDVFISFSHLDGEEVRKLYEKLRQFNLKIFWSEEKLKPGSGFPETIQTALMSSKHFVLFLSDNSLNSEWVEKEWKTFLSKCHFFDADNRKMYIDLFGDFDVKKIPKELSEIHRPKNQLSIISELVRDAHSKSEAELQSIASSQQDEILSLKKQLEAEVKKGAEARDYYRHNRFWRPITEQNEVHVFTCARDVSDDSENKRGQGGRTNIDMWDYRSVFDITHFFASNYPNTKVRIVDPISKLGGKDLTDPMRLAERMTNMRSMLEDKDCVIIGSPDVSDFAEVVLAKLHQISPYSEGREKRRGFVIVKEKKYTNSAFYWEKKQKEEEGVAHLIKPEEYDFIPIESPSEKLNFGKMYGILVVAKNPFLKNEKKRRIIILSGFSGVATNAIAKILTHEECLDEFFKLDKAFENLDKPIEVLVGVKYEIDRNNSDRDTRRISNLKQDITFEKLVEI